MDKLALKTSDDGPESSRGPNVPRRSIPGTGLRGRGGARVLRPVKQPVSSRIEQKTLPLKRPHSNSDTNSFQFKKPTLLSSRNDGSKQSALVPPHRLMNETTSERTRSPSIASTVSSNLNWNIATGSSRKVSPGNLKRAPKVPAQSNRPDSRQENRVPKINGALDGDFLNGNIINGRKITEAQIESGVPFKGLRFLLDIDNKKANEALEKDVVRFGGKIMFCVEETKPPIIVVSDFATAEKLERLSNPLEQLTTPQLKAVPRLVREAWQLGVPLRALSTFSDTIQKIKNKCRIARKLMMGEEHTDETSTAKNVKKKSGPLKSPYIKIEFWPRTVARKKKKGPFTPWAFECKKEENTLNLYVGKDAGKSLFHLASDESKQRRKERFLDHAKFLKKVWDANKEGGVPPELPPKKKRKRDEAVKCNICHVHIEVNCAEEHFASVDHCRAIRVPGLFDSVDEKCGVREEWADIITMPFNQERRIPSPPPQPRSNCSIFQSEWIEDQQPCYSKAEQKAEVDASSVLDGIINAATRRPIDPLIKKYTSAIRDVVDYEFKNGKKIKRVETKKAKESIKTKEAMEFSDPENPVEIMRTFRASVFLDRISDRMGELRLYDRPFKTKPPLKGCFNGDIPISVEELHGIFRNSAKKEEIRKAQEQAKKHHNADEIIEEGSFVSEHSRIDQEVASDREKPFESRKSVDFRKIQDSIDSYLQNLKRTRKLDRKEIKNHILEEIERIRGDKAKIDVKNFVPSRANNARLMKEFAICQGFVKECDVYEEETKPESLGEPELWSPTTYRDDSLEKLRSEISCPDQNEVIHPEPLSDDMNSNSNTFTSFDFEEF